MTLEKFLQVMVKHEASDLFFSAGAPVGIKIQGKTRYLGEHKLSSAETRELAYSVLSDQAKNAEFEREMEMNLALALDGIRSLFASISFASVARCHGNPTYQVRDTLDRSTQSAAQSCRN